jgi:hypothetical protein
MSTETTEAPIVNSTGDPFMDIVMEAQSAASTNADTPTPAPDAGSATGGEPNGGQPADNATPSPDDLLSAKIAELSGGKAKNFDEWKSVIAEESKPKLPPLVEKLSSYLTGGEADPEKFMELYKLSNTDVSQITHLDAIKMKLKLDNPTKDDKWIELEMRDRYSTPPDVKSLEKRLKVATENEDDDAIDTLQSQIADAKAKAELFDHRLGKEGEQAREAIRKAQEDIRWPNLDEQRKNAETEANNRRQGFANAINQAAQQMSQIALKVGNEDFTFVVGDRHKDSLNGVVQSSAGLIDSPFANYIVEQDGKPVFDTGALVRDQFILKNLPTILNAVADKYKNSGTEEIIKGMQNASVPHNNGSAPQGGELTESQRNALKADQTIKNLFFS